MHSYVIFTVLFLTAGFVGFKLGRQKLQRIPPTPMRIAYCSLLMAERRTEISQDILRGWFLGIEHERRG